MKVSVLMTTYNQEAFITQAIESVLMQEVKFDYEIVIGEDASTDRTPEIVAEFQRKHPEKIRVLLRDPIVAERDRAAGVGGKQNFVSGLASLSGRNMWPCLMGMTTGLTSTNYKTSGLPRSTARLCHLLSQCLDDPGGRFGASS